MRSLEAGMMSIMNLARSDIGTPHSNDFSSTVYDRDKENCSKNIFWPTAAPI